LLEELLERGLDPELLARALEEPAQELLAGVALLGLLAEDVRVDADDRGADGERGVRGEEVLHRSHQRRLARAGGADHQDVADAERGQLLGEGDRHLAHGVRLADDALAERARDRGWGGGLGHGRIVSLAGPRAAATAGAAAGGENRRQPLSLAGRLTAARTSLRGVPPAGAWR